MPSLPCWPSWRWLAARRQTGRPPRPLRTTHKPTPKTFTITGTITTDQVGGGHTPGHWCEVPDTESDVGPGSAIVVLNPSGVKVAIGHVGKSTNAHIYGCIMHFTVSGVPDKWGIYSVKVGHRNAIDYSRTRLNRPIGLVLQTSS